MPYASNERDRWNQKYTEKVASWLEPDSFLLDVFPEYIHTFFPKGGRALDLAGGAGRNSIWLAKQDWEVTLIDISEVGIEQARHNAGEWAPHIHFLTDDLTSFTPSRLNCESAFDVVMVFFYLDRRIFTEIVKAIRPGGLLVYKTYTTAQLKLAGTPKDPRHLLEPDELLRLTEGLRVLHYREEISQKATAELVAMKDR